mmetsp:Transcript_22444/g.45389  ORF Transcript_22444/g.45389 Transcript_22444/m.45389 type:complete len:244 (+) Transcript_22444:901-1632(+)
MPGSSAPLWSTLKRPGVLPPSKPCASRGSKGEAAARALIRIQRCRCCARGRPGLSMCITASSTTPSDADSASAATGVARCRRPPTPQGRAARHQRRARMSPRWWRLLGGHARRARRTPPKACGLGSPRAPWSRGTSARPALAEEEGFQASPSMRPCPSAFRAWAWPDSVIPGLAQRTSAGPRPRRLRPFSWPSTCQAPLARRQAPARLSSSRPQPAPPPAMSRCRWSLLPPPSAVATWTPACC